MCKFPGDGEGPLRSVGDVIVLLAGDALLCKGSDREAGLVIFFISYIKMVTGLIRTVLVFRTKKR